MITPPGYINWMYTDGMYNWPKLIENVNFRFTSLWDTDFNCFAYAIREEHKKEFMHMGTRLFQKRFKLDPNNLDHSPRGYAKCLEMIGYVECDINDSQFEEGFEKIALYGDAKDRWTLIHPLFGFATIPCLRRPVKRLFPGRGTFT